MRIIDCHVIHILLWLPCSWDDIHNWRVMKFFLDHLRRLFIRNC